MLRLEGPENIYAFPRVDRARRTCAIHVVNWNLGDPGAERAEAYASVTVTLLHPERWGNVTQAVWHEPGQPSMTLTPERHTDSVRLTLPRLTTWGILEIRP